MYYKDFGLKEICLQDIAFKFNSFMEGLSLYNAWSWAITSKFTVH